MSSRNRFRNNTNRNKYGQSVKVGENRDANAGVGNERRFNRRSSSPSAIENTNQYGHRQHRYIAQ